MNPYDLNEVAKLMRVGVTVKTSPMMPRDIVAFCNPRTMELIGVMKIGIDWRRELWRHGTAKD
jgi:hypothetical protein